MFQAVKLELYQVATESHGPDGEIGRHCGLKIRRFVNSGRAGSIPARGTSIHAASSTYIDWKPHLLTRFYGIGNVLAVQTTQSASETVAIPARLA